MRRKHVVAGVMWLLSGCTEEAPPEDQPPPGVAEVDLGPITSDTSFTMTIPPNTIGFQLVAELDGNPGLGRIGIAELVSPSGEKVVESFNSTGNHIPFETDFGIVAVSIPQTSATAKAPIEAGEWTVTASLDGNAPAHAKVFVRTTEDGEFHGGELDLRIYIPDGLVVATPTAHPITAATAGADPTITQQVDSFYTTLKQVFDLDRGDVEFVALPSEFASITDLQKRDDAMRMTSNPDTGPVMHFVLANELTFVNGNTAWGMATWNPGVATTTGHPIAGVFVNISLSRRPTADGMTMVHEMGHFLGLYHTTEGDRTFHDPLDDTPECQPNQQPCPDGTNIMFVTFFGASGGVGLTASDQQRRVVWGSPLYR